MTHSITIGDISFDSLPKEILYSIFKDGRASSKLMEYFFAERYNFKVVLGDKDHDLITPANQRFEIKAFTKYGCGFGPSMHTGDKGLAREIREKEGDEAYDRHTQKKAKELTERTSGYLYIIYNIIDFPTITFRLIRGSKLLEEFPNGKISFKQGAKFFG